MKPQQLPMRMPIRRKSNPSSTLTKSTSWAWEGEMNNRPHWHQPQPRCCLLILPLILRERACFFYTHSAHFSISMQTKRCEQLQRVYRKIEWFFRSKMIHFSLSFVHIYTSIYIVRCWYTCRCVWLRIWRKAVTLNLIVKRRRRRRRKNTWKMFKWCVCSCQSEILCKRFCLSKCFVSKCVCVCGGASWWMLVKSQAYQATMLQKTKASKFKA